MKYKEGDRVRVAPDWSSYSFRMIENFNKNNIVEIVVARTDDCKIRDYLGNTWWILYKDIIGFVNQCGYFIS